MTCQPTTLQLSDEQKGQICGILSVGCDRQTAADFVGCSLADIRRALEQDATFLANVRRAEAGVELSHMRNVQEVAKEKRDWRASVWWLEHRSPERFGRRGPNVVTTRQLRAFVGILVDVLSSEITNAADRERVVTHLQTIAASIEQMLRDSLAESVGKVGAKMLSQQFAAENESAEVVAGDALDFNGQD